MSNPVLEGVVVDPPHKVRGLFRRDPAVWTGLIEGIIAFLLLLPLGKAIGLTQESATLVIAVVSGAVGAYTAWATRDTALGYLLGAGRALVSLVLYYGQLNNIESLTLDAGQQAALFAILPLLVGAFQRTQTTPVDYPISPSPEQVVAAPTSPEPGPAVDPTDVAPEGVQVDPVLPEPEPPHGPPVSAAIVAQTFAATGPGHAPPAEVPGDVERGESWDGH